MESPIYELNTEGKFLYIRHGETQKNKTMEKIDKSKLISTPEFLDCELDIKVLNKQKRHQK